jgi:hypothetical protein
MPGAAYVNAQKYPPLASTAQLDPRLAPGASRAPGRRHVSRVSSGDRGRAAGLGVRKLQCDRLREHVRWAAGGTPPAGSRSAGNDAADKLFPVGKELIDNRHVHAERRDVAVIDAGEGHLVIVREVALRIAARFRPGARGDQR